MTPAAPAVLDTPDAAPYPDSMDVVTEAAELPPDREAIPDDTQIGPAVWAALQGVALSTVYRNNTLASKRRAAGTVKAGDMPEPARHIGQTPVWSMSAYRAWQAGRPGKGAGAGRPRRPGGPAKRERASLPLDCPHCGEEITAGQVRAARAKTARADAAGRGPSRR
jgi:hypothetical protein